MLLQSVWITYKHNVDVHRQSSIKTKAILFVHKDLTSNAARWFKYTKLYKNILKIHKNLNDTKHSSNIYQILILYTIL